MIVYGVVEDVVYGAFIGLQLRSIYNLITIP